MTKFSNILKKNLFLAHFPNFGSKNVFPENPALSRTTSHRILVPCQSSEETNDTNPRKRLDRRADGRTDGRKVDRPYFQDPSGYHRRSKRANSWKQSQIQSKLHPKIMKILILFSSYGLFSLLLSSSCEIFCPL